MSTSASGLPTPPILADHPALDLLNTQMMVEGCRQDLLTTDHEAARWLEQIGLGPVDELAGAGDGRLLGELRTLRQVIETLVQACLESRWADPSALNGLLRHAVPQLVWKPTGAPSLQRFSAPDPVSRKVSEIALSAAQLLAEGDISLVRQCESHDCTLMFYDRTKAHKRRWCSMALCGNRHKVAEFRKRRQAPESSQ